MINRIRQLFAKIEFRGSSQNVKVNGVSIQAGGDLVIDGDKITSGGEVVCRVNDKNVQIVIEGDAYSIQTGSGDVHVHGHVGSVKTGSGDVYINGDAQQDVQTSSGDVDVKGNIEGTVCTSSGDIHFR